MKYTNINRKINMFHSNIEHMANKYKNKCFCGRKNKNFPAAIIISDSSAFKAVFFLSFFFIGLV